jgi:sugar phosphate isomerase/epimerase
VSGASLERLSLNQATTQRWDMRQTIEGCAREGIGWLGVWRDKLAAMGVAETARHLRTADVRVSSLCRGGFFPAATDVARAAALDDNRRAIDEAAEIGAPVLVLVSGPPSDRDIDLARRQVEEGICALLDYASERRVTLAVEPLHPMFAGDRSVVVTLAQANHMVERIGSPVVGVAVDVYHVWWDPDVYQQIARAGQRIVGFHVSDWLAPPPDHLLGRGVMGDGLIELRRLREAVDAAGYAGPIEVEIFNRGVWDMPGEDALQLLKERYRAWC